MTIESKSEWSKVVDEVEALVSVQVENAIRYREAQTSLQRAEARLKYLGAKIDLRNFLKDLLEPTS